MVFWDVVDLVVDLRVVVGFSVGLAVVAMEEKLGSSTVNGACQLIGESTGTTDKIPPRRWMSADEKDEVGSGASFND